MRVLERTTRFKRDYKRERKNDPKLDTDFIAVIELLLADMELPKRLRDHPLSGEWIGFRDCHIRPDLVLIYEKIGDNVLSLTRIGSHSELFG